MKKIQESTYKKIYYFVNVPLLFLFTFIISILYLSEEYIKEEAKQTIVFETYLYANDLQSELLENLDKTIVLLEKFKPKEKGLKTKIKEGLTKFFVKKEETGQLENFINKSKEKINTKVKEQFHSTLDNMEEKYDIVFDDRSYQGVVDHINKLRSNVANINIDENSIESIVNGNNYSYDENHLITKIFTRVRDYYNNTLNLLMDDLKKIPIFGFFVFLLAVLGGYFTKREDDFFYPMLIATAVIFIGTSMYVLNQNWVYNILTNNFVGGTYTVVMSIILLFEIDIIFNRARISEGLLRSLPDIIENIDFDLPDISIDV